MKESGKMEENMEQVLTHLPQETLMRVFVIV